MLLSAICSNVTVESDRALVRPGGAESSNFFPLPTVKTSCDFVTKGRHSRWCVPARLVVPDGRFAEQESFAAISDGFQLHAGIEVDGGQHFQAPGVTQVGN